MSYKKAAEVLPQEILQMLQEYVSGEYLYIPRKEEQKKSWGENTGVKKEMKARNTAIFRDYNQGMKIGELAEKYFLSYKSVQRILTQERRKMRG